MKKFFKFGNHKRKDFNKDRRNSLASLGSSGSLDTVVPSSWDSGFALNLSSESSHCYKVDVRDDKTLTKLHKACWLGNLEKVKKHISKAAVKSVDSQHRTPLHLATAQAHKDIISFLLEWNGQLNARDINGFTPLLKAIECGHVEIAEFLLERGANPKAFEKNGNTGLHLIAASGQQVNAVTLIHKGANIDAQNKDGMTPLLVSTVHRHLEVTNLLIRLGASLDIPDTRHKSCLIHACEVGCLDHVKLFLRHGVEVMHKDIDGFTAEEIAMVSGYDEITKIIREQTLLKGPQELKTNTTYSSFEDSQLGFPASYDDDIACVGNRQSQEDLNDAENDSWNDDTSEEKESALKLSEDVRDEMGPLSGINLLKLKAFQENHDLSNDVLSSGLPNKGEIPCVSNNIKDLEDKSASLHKNPSVYDNVELIPDKDEQRNSENDTSSSNMSLFSENGGEKMKITEQHFNSAVVKDQQRNPRCDIDLMAELGLSDISEMTTTSLSKPCGDDGERESDNSDLEDFENCDNALPQIDTENELSDTFKRYSVDIVNSEVVTLHNQSTLSTVKDSTFQTEYPPGHSLCHRSLDGDVFILDSHVIEPLNNQSNSLGIPETGHFGSHQTNSFTLNKKAEMEDRNSNFNSEHHVMAIIPPISQSLEESLDKHLLSGNFKLCDLKENTADSPCHSLSKKNDVGDLENVKDELDSLDKQMRIDVLYDNGNNHLTPEKHVYEPSSRKEGTLGRIDTMHEVEEIWASNPCMESSTPDVAILTNLSTGNYTRNSILEALRSNSELENFTECASQKESVKDGSISKCDEVMIDKTKIWDQILIMIFGKLDSENDTGSDSELSPLSCVADHLSRESCPKESICQEISVTDERTSTLSVKDDDAYRLLIHVLQADAVGINRVIGIIQELKLLWKKEQDKSRVLNHRIERLKHEIGKAEERIHILSSDKSLLENRLHQVDSEVEALKHSLVVESNHRLEAEMQVNRGKIQIKSLEEALMDNMLVKQEAELTVKSNQNHLKSTHELFLQFQDHITERSSKTYTDAACQTVDIQCEDCHFKEHGKDCEENFLNQKMMSLEHHADLLMMSNEDEKKQRNEAEDKIRCLETEISNLNYKFGACNAELEKNLKECNAVSTERDKLIKQVKDLTQQNMDLSSIVTVTEEKNNQLLSQLTDANCNFEEMKLKAYLLEKEISSEKSCENRIKLELQTNEAEKNQLKIKVNELQEQLDHLQSNYLKVELELQNSTRINGVLEDQVLHLQKMLDALSSTIHKDQEKTLKHLHEYNQNLTKSRDTLQANVTTLNNAIEELNRKLKLSAIENSQLSDKLKVVQSESDSKVEEMNILEDKYCATIEKLEKANEVIEACKAKEIYHCNEMEMLKQKMKNLLSVEEEVSALKLQVMRANDHATKAEECVTDLEKKLDEQILTNRSHTDLFKKELANTYENLNNINIVLKQMNTKSSNLGQLRPDMKTNIGRDEFSTTRTRMEFTSTPELCEKGGTVQADSLTRRLTNETNEYPKAGRISDEDFISDHHVPNSVYGNSNFQHPLTSICDRLTNAVPDRLYNASIKRNSSNSLEEIEIDLLDLQGELERIKKLQENNKHCEINPAEEESVLFYNKKASLEAFQEKVEHLRRELHAEKVQRHQHDTDIAWLTKKPRRTDFTFPYNTVNSKFWYQKEMDQVKDECVAETHREINLHLAHITKLLEERVREDDNLKWSHTKGSELHQGYHYAIQNLNLEVRRLSDHLKDKALYQATLEEHYNLISQLRNARKRVKAKLDKSKNHSRPLRRSSVDASKDEYLLASPNRNFSRDLVYNANGGGHVDSWSTFNNTGYSKIWKSVFH